MTMKWLEAQLFPSFAKKMAEREAAEAAINVAIEELNARNAETRARIEESITICKALKAERFEESLAGLAVELSQLQEHVHGNLSSVARAEAQHERGIIANTSHLHKLQLRIEALEAWRKS